MKALRWIENGIRRFRVGTRLMGGFALMLIFILLVGGTGVGGMHRLAGRIESIVTFNNAKLGLAQTLVRSLAEQEKALLHLAQASSAQEKDRAKATINYQVTQYTDTRKGLDEMFVLARPDSFEDAVLKKLADHEQKVPGLLAKGFKLDADEDAEGLLKALREEILPAMSAWVTDLDELVSTEQRLNDSAAAEAAKDYLLLRYVSLGTMALAIVLGVLVAFSISRGLLREMGGEPSQAAWVASEIARGNLAVDVPLRAGTEGSLMAALQGTVVQLSPVLLSINQATETINTAATEIAAGNLDLSKRTEEQAASLEETAASMEQLTATVQQNAENANQANRLAAGASEVAVKGGQAVSQVVATMSSINAASRKIVDIIAVIDGIAFQTNILALNAAVEAARAGEQGRGFAVVASEVRSLAQRSADAAKQIKTLISESVERVAEGSRLVDGAGATMGEIVDAVKRVTEIMAEISSASQQQYSGISQVNTAITQMDEATQRNAALVEQATAAAESMREQAGKLVQAVAAFKLREG